MRCHTEPDYNQSSQSPLKKAFQRRKFTQRFSRQHSLTKKQFINALNNMLIDLTIPQTLKVQGQQQPRTLRTSKKSIRPEWDVAQHSYQNECIQPTLYQNQMIPGLTNNMFMRRNLYNISTLQQQTHVKNYSFLQQKQKSSRRHARQSLRNINSSRYECQDPLPPNLGNQANSVLLPLARKTNLKSFTSQFRLTGSLAKLARTTITHNDSLNNPFYKIQVPRRQEEKIYRIKRTVSRSAAGYCYNEGIMQSQSMLTEEYIQDTQRNNNIGSANREKSGTMQYHEMKHYYQSKYGK